MDRPQRPCANCAKPHAPQRCLCHMASYCGSVCQQAHWKDHRKTCSVHESTNIERLKKEYGRDSLETITAQYNVCGTFRGTEQYGKAEKILLKCLKRCDAQHFETSSRKMENSVIVHILLRLGENYTDQHQFDAGKDMLDRALLIANKLYGGDDPIVLLIKHRLMEHSGQHKNDGCEIEFLEKALMSCKVDDHESIISISHSLCCSYCNTGKLDLAMQAGMKSLAHARDTSNMGSVGDALLRISVVQSKKGEWDQALSKLQEALPILRTEFGEKNISVADALFQLGEIHVHHGAYKDALSVYKKALRYTRRCGGDKQRNLQLYTIRILNVYCQLKQFTQALRMLANDEAFFRHILSDHDTVISRIRQLRDLQSL
jgi:tetratricopeptide (TPR) repeat protein